MKTGYLRNGLTLELSHDLCTGCGDCVEVCPHAVFEVAKGKVKIMDRAACMECGACAVNCPARALRVKAGVGCAAAVIGGMLRGTAPSCGCGCDGASKKGACCG